MASQPRPRGRVQYVWLWGLAVTGSITAVLHGSIILGLTPGGSDADFFTWLWVFNGLMFATWGITGLRNHHRASARGKSADR